MTQFNFVLWPLSLLHSSSIPGYWISCGLPDLPFGLLRENRTLPVSGSEGFYVLDCDHQVSRHKMNQRHASEMDHEEYSKDISLVLFTAIFVMILFSILGLVVHYLALLWSYLYPQNSISFATEDATAYSDGTSKPFEMICEALVTICYIFSPICAIYGLLFGKLILVITALVLLIPNVIWDGLYLQKHAKSILASTSTTFSWLTHLSQMVLSCLVLICGSIYIIGQYMVRARE